MNQNNKTLTKLSRLDKDIPYDVTHWWEFPLTDFSVQFNYRFKKEFFDSVYHERGKSNTFAIHLSKASNKYGKDWSFKTQRQLIWAYKDQTKFIPAWFVYEVAVYLGLGLSLIEKNIVSYITFRGKSEVYKPKLPILVTPEFTAVVVHVMCDGHFTNSGKINYTQKDKDNVSRFIHLLQDIFGSYEFIESKRKDGFQSTYTPKIFGKIISTYYNISDFSTFGCRIPSKIMHSSKLDRLSVLSSFLLDEGHTMAGTVFSSSNNGLLMDVMGIAQSLGYGCNHIITYSPSDKRKITQNHYRFSLRASSLEKFYLDLKQLFRTFPTLYMGKKFENIKNVVRTKNRGWNQRNKGETKKIILDSLKEGDKTAHELRDLANISVWTVYHHLQQLMNKGKITKYFTKSGTFLYKLV